MPPLSKTAMGRMNRTVVVLSLGLVIAGLGGLYACARLNRLVGLPEGQRPAAQQPAAQQPAVQRPAAPQSPTRVMAAEAAPQPQTSPGPDVFEAPDQLPMPGPPFARANRDPEVVLKDFPRAAGGEVDWVKSLGLKEAKDKLYSPRHRPSLDPKLPPDSPPFPFDIEIPAIGAMPNVVFPHFPHTALLDCANCHPGIFIMKKGSNPISMVKIVNGQFCGRCHGRVAFPISNCTRCHVKPKG